MQASPSKARAEALEAHSWSLVLAWLANLYHPAPLPSFERNAATLAALKSLMTEITAADRARQLLHDARVEELGAEQQDGLSYPLAEDDAESLLRLLESSLPEDSKKALDDLARSALLLGCGTSLSVLQTLRSRILNLPHQTFALETQIASIDDLIEKLDVETTRTLQLRPTCSVAENHSQPTSPPTSPPPILLLPTANHVALTADAAIEQQPSTAGLHAQTLQYQGETKQLQLKCEEYKSRIAALERQAAAASHASGGLPTLADLAAEQHLVNRKKEKIEALKAQIVGFHGLPPDVEASRAEVQRAQGELDALKRKRDELFERMGR